MSVKQALRSFCDLYDSSDVRCEWILVGSLASVLQGADMEPNDVDIYVKSEEDVKTLSMLMYDYCQLDPIHVPISHPEWRSSVELPYLTQRMPSGFTWSKGRWTIHSVPLEVVQIFDSAGIPDSLEGEGIWEGGKYIWDYAKTVEFGKYNISVVPLEIQLESNLRRKREARARNIIAALEKNGYDKNLLKKAVSSKHFDEYRELLMHLI